MIIDIKNLLSNSEEIVPLKTELDFSMLQLQGIHPITEPVKIVGKLENHAGIVTLGYLAMFTLNTQCDRCLTDVSSTLTETFTHTIVSRLNVAENDNFLVCEDGKLDFYELAWSDVLLSLPSKTVCREDCAGICPTCGANLNEQPCDCNKKTIDPRLQILADLLENNKQ